MRRASYILAFWLLATAGWAQQVVLDFTGATPGVSYYKLTISATGALSFEQIQVIVLKPGPPQPEPPTPQLSADAKLLRDAAKAVTGDANRQKTAILLADAYEAVAAKIKAGSLTGNDIATVTKADVDAILKTQEAAAPWQPFRDALSGRWAAILQEGGGDPALGTLCQQGAIGLRESAK